MQQLVKEFTKGLWTELPPFRLVLGLCPTLAVTKTADNGLGMGLAVIFVGRAEAFAAKNTVPLAIADGLGMGLGFTMSLTFLGSIREVFGAGTLFGTPVMWEGFRPFSVMVEAPGAFLCLGLILAAMNLINRWQAKRKGREEPENISSGCASCGGCSGGKS